MIRFAARFWFVVIPQSLTVCGRIAALLLPILPNAQHDRRVKAGATAEQAKAGVEGAVSGATWQILLNDDHTYKSLSHDAAGAACAAMGPGHRLPRGPEIPLLEPRESAEFHYAWLVASETREPTTAGVLCVKGDVLDALVARVEANKALPTSATPSATPAPTVSGTPLHDLATQ